MAGAFFQLEHVRSTATLLGGMMDLTIPIVVRATGVTIHRRTVENVSKSRLKLEGVDELGPGGSIIWLPRRASGEIASLRSQ